MHEYQLATSVDDKMKTGDASLSVHEDKRSRVISVIHAKEGTMSDYDNLKKEGKLDQTYGSVNASRETIDLVKTSASHSTTVPKEQYEKLAEKFEDAMKLVEAMRSKIQELESNKMPTKDEVESISSMLDLLGKLDDNAISRINKLGKMNNE